MQIKLTKLYMLWLATGVVFTSALLLGIPVVQSSDLHQNNSVANSSETSDEIIDRQVVEDGEVFLIQTRSKGVELIPEAKIVTMTQNFFVIIEDENSEIIRVFEGLGDGFDLIVTAVMSEAEASQLLESDEKIVEPIESDNRSSY